MPLARLCVHQGGSDVPRNPNVRDLNLRDESPKRSVSFDVFAENFERCFEHLHGYVSRRARSREDLERVVSAVLLENLSLLVYRRPCHEEVERLEACADRLLKGDEPLEA